MDRIQWGTLPLATTTTTCGDDDDLPEDILIQILVWLPVISLLRFRSVCKSWRALIETPFFIDLHTTTTTTTFFNSSSKFGSFILYGRGTSFMLSSRSRYGCGGGDEDIMAVDYLGFPPFNYFLSPMWMVGSCNGLICLHDVCGEHHNFVYLWNPATRQFRILPKPLIIQEEKQAEVEKEELRFDELGTVNVVNLPFVVFGFDVKTKDYKVVMIKPFKTIADQFTEFFCRIQIYSLSTDSWRLLEGLHWLPVLPHTYTFQNHGVYMNGCYFFVGKNNYFVDDTPYYNNSLMYSFDFTKEILTTMQCPDHDRRHDLILSCLGGEKIVLFMIQRNLFTNEERSQFHDCGLDNEYYDMWMLNEQPGSRCIGVVNKESWTKLHSFRKINKLKNRTQPRCILNNGEFALISTSRIDGEPTELELFNLVTKEAITEPIAVGRGILTTDVYMQSLVSIGGNGATTTTETMVCGDPYCSCVF